MSAHFEEGWMKLSYALFTNRRYCETAVSQTCSNQVTELAHLAQHPINITTSFGNVSPNSACQHEIAVGVL